MQHKKRAMAALVVVALAGLAACSSGTPATTPGATGGDAGTPTHLTIASATDSTYNPLQNGPGMGEIPVSAVYDNLVYWQESDDSFQPWLAESFTLNDTLTTMDMTLRGGVKFSDGTTLDAAGVVKELTMIRDDPEGDTSSFVDLKGTYGAQFTATGDLTLTMTTTAPMDHSFMQVLDNVPIVSAKALDDQDSLNTTPVGSGPYILDPTNSTSGVELNYTRSPDYWNKAAFPYDTLTIKQYDDTTAAFNALKTGQVDATNIAIESIQEAQTSGFNTPIANPVFRLFRFGDLQGKVNPAIGNVKVRQAISMAFDRDAINKALNFGFGTISSQIFAKGTVSYLDGGDNVYAYDPTQAKQLLADAGYPNGFELKIPTYPSTAQLDPIVIQYLGAIGITVTDVPYPDAATWLDSLGKYAAFAYNSAIYVNMATDHIRTGGAFIKWPVDQQAQTLITTINSTSGDAQKAAGQQLGKLVQDDAWMTSMSSKPSAWATIKAVDLPVQPISGVVRLRTIKPAA